MYRNLDTFRQHGELISLLSFLKKGKWPKNGGKKYASYTGLS
jgi:hypothetical protein